MMNSRGLPLSLVIKVMRGRTPASMERYRSTRRCESHGLLGADIKVKCMKFQSFGGCSERQSIAACWKTLHYISTLLITVMTTMVWISPKPSVITDDAEIEPRPSHEIN